MLDLALVKVPSEYKSEVFENSKEFVDMIPISREIPMTINSRITKEG